ncbi:hypothetical protein [Dokdonia sp. Hel_I_53]|uniref:hypothetical protein n=1 Tax=Dokdonia sp. Hel_I_53 TaxID=1566287 RepID=UPI00119ADDD0|nr:hypothetical protein [Dokdonia sp. Hel_I_53]TVZ52121.1 hypothetical protein OD90_1285 [Dokdonia sp. Hel_I_53]
MKIRTRFFILITNFSIALTAQDVDKPYFESMDEKEIVEIEDSTLNLENKTIPEEIYDEAILALNHYPELWDTEITFQFKENIKKSTMQAQPTWASFFKSRKKRSYIILISRNILIDQDELKFSDVPNDVVTGWLGHELGHVMDYRERSSFGMLIFGIKYLYSGAHIREVERTADVYAITHGMGTYILKTKNFILEHANISELYKERLRSLYMSPEEVMHMLEHEHN